MKLFFIVLIPLSFIAGQEAVLANQCKNKPGHSWNWDYGKCEEVKK